MSGKRIVLIEPRSPEIEAHAVSDGYEVFVFRTKNKQYPRDQVDLMISLATVPYRILGYVEALRPDAVFGQFNSSGLHLQIVKHATGRGTNFFKALKALTPVVMLQENDCFKAFHAYSRAMSEEAHAALYRHIDIIGCDSLGIIPAFEKLGVKTAVNMVNCVNPPDWHVGDLPVERDVCFTGSKIKMIDRGFVAERTQLLKTVAGMEGIKFHIFGKNWEKIFPQHLKGNVPKKQLPKIFKTSKICLNHIQITPFDQPLEWYYGVTNGRMFEITASGGFLLSSYVPGVEKFFELGREIEVYRTIDELKTKIRYYLDHEDERREIARRGQERTLRDYTARNAWRTIKTCIENAQSSAEAALIDG